MSNLIRIASCLFACWAEAANAAGSAHVIPTSAATAVFAEADALCKADAGALWGETLCIPRIFVDPATRQAVLNEPATGARKDGSLYRFILPADLPLSDTAVKLDGKLWSLIFWPLPRDAALRHVMLMHEAFHTLQPGLGLKAPVSDLGSNGHLDTRDGRIWMRAEFAALRVALTHSGEARRRALDDALLFRAYRRSLWPGAAIQERSLELIEGTAEATGVDAGLGTLPQRIAAAVRDIDTTEGYPSYVRSFAYATGPAYGELLDAKVPDWRRHVTSDFDFGVAAAKAYGLTEPRADAARALRAFRRYDGAQVIAEEDARARRIAAADAHYRAALITGPTLTFPLRKFTINFNPQQVHDLRGQGSVYEILHISDIWGSLDVKSGMALITKAFDQVSVPLAGVPKGTHLSGAGWTAELVSGSTLVPDSAKPGSYILSVTPIAGTH